jgi:hypothetical protein
MSADERERSHLVRQHVKGGLGRREASERMEIGVSPVQTAGLFLATMRRRGHRVPPSRPAVELLPEWISGRPEIAALLNGLYAGFGETWR